MKFLNVSATNMDIIMSINEVLKNRSGFPKNIAQILNRVCIKIDVEEISAPEALIIKQVSSSVNIKNYKGTPDDIIKALEQSRKESSNGLKECIKYVYKKYPDTWAYLPVGCGLFNVTAIFTGSSILNFFGYDFDKFFEMNNKDEDLNKNLELNIIAAFHSMIYKKWASNLTDADVITESWLSDNVFNRIDYNESLIASRLINTEGIEVSFINTDVDSLSKKLEEFKSTLDKNTKYAKLEFCCCTSLFVYYILSLYAKTDVTIDTSSMSKLTGETYPRKYTRMTDAISGIIDPSDKDMIDSLFNNEVSNLKEAIKLPVENSPLFIKQLYLPSTVKIKYSLTVNLNGNSKITDFFNEDGINSVPDMNEFNMIKKIFKNNISYINNYLI